MTTKNLLFVAIASLSMLMPSVLNAQTNSASTTGYANIVAPITLAKNADLNFGTMSVGSSGGTCVLATDASRSKTGDVVLSTGSPTSACASFTVSGNINTTYAISLPSSFTVSSGSKTMTVSLLAAKAESASSNSTTGTLSSTGSDKFVLGGTLTVGASQTAGSYSGTFNVSVDYN